MRHKAILELYPECIGITDGIGAFDKDEKIIDLDETLINNKIEELKNAEPLKLLREERNIKLAETDWRASSDLTLSSEWSTYRQALRDLPSTATPTLDDDGNLQNVTWPEEPT
jgi:hypothetical protein